jgi:hypothetical protein
MSAKRSSGPGAGHSAKKAKYDPKTKSDGGLVRLDSPGRGARPEEMQSIYVIKDVYEYTMTRHMKHTIKNPSREARKAAAK